ncbi:hypothetical protein JTE90_001455 [Oedothorax gibbosus]|uniref:Uncharacterized protein n=1 Tax=Oedothorax gibbosus TaxID=931172 RepID=A0AAV6TFQ0_9ARAC|nr:hypothetical protein JTE90_001455 [Oedothorax gibbosus]
MIHPLVHRPVPWLRLLFPLNIKFWHLFRHVGSTRKPNRQPIRIPLKYSTEIARACGKAGDLINANDDSRLLKISLSGDNCNPHPSTKEVLTGVTHSFRKGNHDDFPSKVDPVAPDI